MLLFLQRLLVTLRRAFGRRTALEETKNWSAVASNVFITGVSGARAPHQGVVRNVDDAVLGTTDSYSKRILSTRRPKIGTVSVVFLLPVNVFLTERTGSEK